MASSALPKKAILAVTSGHVQFYEDGKKTGLFYVEGLHPYETLTEAGFQVDIVSETGTCGLDEHSVQDDFLGEDKKTYENDQHPFNVSLKTKVLKASDLDPKQYGLFFAAGGHGTLFDFPKATALQNIASDIYKRGGVVAAVCHGPAILPGIKDENGKPIIEGKNVTGFTEEGEVQMKLLDKMKAEKLGTVEEDVKKVGAKYVAPPEPWGDFSITDGRLVSGVNPASAKSTAQKAIQAFSG